MKAFVVIILSSFLFSTVYANKVQKKDNQIEIHVNGMVCSFCAQGIKNISKNSSVESVSVDLKSKKVYLKLKANKKITNKIIESTIKDAGYNISKIIRDSSEQQTISFTQNINIKIGGNDLLSL